MYPVVFIQFVNFLEVDTVAKLQQYPQLSSDIHAVINGILFYMA